MHLHLAPPLDTVGRCIVVFPVPDAAVVKGRVVGGRRSQRGWSGASVGGGVWWDLGCWRICGWFSIRGLVRSKTIVRLITVGKLDFGRKLDVVVKFEKYVSI